MLARATANITSRPVPRTVTQILDSKADARRKCPLSYSVLYTDNTSEWVYADTVLDLQEMVDAYHRDNPGNPGPLSIVQHPQRKRRGRRRVHSRSIVISDSAEE